MQTRRSRTLTATLTHLGVLLIALGAQAQPEPPPPPPPAEPAPPPDAAGGAGGEAGGPAEGPVGGAPVSAPEPPPPPPPPPPPRAKVEASVKTEAPTKQAVTDAVAEEASEAPRDLPVAGYDKGFFIQSPDGKYRLEPAGMVQFRFTYEGFEHEPDRFAFSIARARIRLKGHVFTPDLGFDIQVEFGKGGIPTLKDAFIDYRAVEKILHFRAGQYKVPWMRHQMTSVTRLIMVDRAITDKAFGGGRDIGVMVHNGYEKSPMVEYAVGLFNGTTDKPVFEDGAQSNIPERFRPEVAARLGYNFGDLKGYDEVDFDGGGPRFGIAANSRAILNADEGDDGIIDVGGDTILKVIGLTIHGGVYARWEQDGDAFKDQSRARWGVQTEAGYLIAGHFQPGVRYARIMPRADDENVQQEILGGLSAFAFKHNVKATMDGGVLLEREPGDTVVDWIIRTQLQLLL